MLKVASRYTWNDNLNELDYRTKALAANLYMNAAGTAAVAGTLLIVSALANEFFALMALSSVTKVGVASGVGYLWIKNPEAGGAAAISLLETVGQASNIVFQKGKDVAAWSLEPSITFQEEEPAVTFHEESVQDEEEPSIQFHEEDSSFIVVTVHEEKALGNESFILVDLK